MFRLFIDCLLLKRHAYEHVEEYSSYTYYALAVIVTTSLTGAFRLAILEGQPFSIGYVLLSLTFWVVLTGIVFALGTTLMKTSETKLLAVRSRFLKRQLESYNEVYEEAQSSFAEEYISGAITTSANSFTTS